MGEIRRAKGGCSEVQEKAEQNRREDVVGENERRMEHESIRKKEGRVRRVKKEGGKREWGEEEERGG